MERTCNKQHIFDFIIKYYKLMDGNLYRKYKNRDDWRHIPGALRGKYLTCKVDNYYVCVHHVVMVVKTQKKIPDGMVIDHIDGNPMNNNPCNLRIVTPKINRENRKVSKVSMIQISNIVHRGPGRYRVRYISSGRIIDLGCFDTISRAVAARNKSYAIHAPERLACVMRRGG